MQIKVEDLCFEWYLVYGRKSACLKFKRKYYIKNFFTIKLINKCQKLIRLKHYLIQSILNYANAILIGYASDINLVWNCRSYRFILIRYFSKYLYIVFNFVCNVHFI